MIKRSLYYLLSSFLFFTACGGCDDDDENNCSGVVCDRGICDLSSGECINANDCGGSDDACLAGFSCDTNTCSAAFPCDAAGNCENGVCEAGACVNPETCNSNSACIPGFFCGDDSTCVEDPCDDTSCERGVCAVGVGECVNADACTAGSEAEDCLEGFRCVEGACTDEDAFCDSLGCDRGVCSFEEAACVDAGDCGGSDMNCLAGNYCADDNTCQPNVCDTLMTNCPRGVCEESSGTCVNADPCNGEDECIDGNLCVGNACVPTDDACQVGGCPGTQECVYDGATLSAACEESAMGCTTALDCLDDRVCNAGACEAPTPCASDALEPNNVAGEETDFAATAVNGTITEATICANDVDLYRFDTREDVDLFGVLAATVVVAPSNIGLGTINVELVNGSDQVVASGNNLVNGVPTDTASAQFDIDVISQGVYSVRVSGENVSTAGLVYDVLIDVLDGDVLLACDAPVVADTTAPQTGDTTNGTSLGAKTCADADGNLTEEIWVLDVPQNSYATIRATPQVGVDVALSIRSTCGLDDSEIACEGGGATSEFEELTLPLDAGTYYIIVEAQNAGGSYLLSADLAPVICTVADNNCLDVDNANVCNTTGTAFDVEACANGCDQVAGRCDRLPGDVCTTAIPVDNAVGVDTTINWGDFTADYDPGPGSCLPDNSFTANDEDSDGPDAVYSVTVPANSALFAEIDSPGSNQQSVYFVTNCQDVANTCLAGGNNGSFSDESIVYVNSTAADVAGFVIFDTDAASSTFTPPPIRISVDPVVCTPGARQCVLNRESQLCNDAGTAFESTTICDNGCDDQTGECVLPQNDLCSGAITLTPGVPTVGDTSIFNNNYASNSSGCSTSGNGADAVFLLENLQIGDSVDIELDASFDSVLWVATTCEMDDSISGCISAADSGNPETLSFVVSTAGDYFVVADTWSSFATPGPFTITANVAPAVCTPGDLLGCADANNLEYCDDTGQPAQLACIGGCANSACGTPGGDFCFDAIPLAANNTVQNVAGDWDLFSNSIELNGNAGQCFFSTPTDEGDVFYRVDVPAGFTLEATYDSPSTSTNFFLLEGDCSMQATSCFGNNNDDGDHTIEYFAPVSTTVYLVVDSTSSFATSTYDIDYQLISTPNRDCSPNNNVCLSATDVQTCDENGVFGPIFTCPGGCTNGVCADDPATMETCITAPNVGKGISLDLTFGDYVDDVNPSGSANCDVNGAGHDAHLAFDLAPDELLVVDIESTFGSAVGYIYTDCNDIVNSCQAAQASDPEKLVYQSPIQQTVFLAIDYTFNGTSASASVDARVTPPECVNGQAPVCNAAGDALETCDNGLIVEYACGSTVSTCTGSTCDQPRGNACFDTITLPRTTGQPNTVAGSFSTSQPLAFDAVGNQQTGQCRITGSATARDVVYTMSLLQNDRVTFTMDGATDNYILISSSCDDATQCKAQNLVNQDYTLDYVAPADEVIYVIVRSEFSSSTDFDLTYEITPGFAGACTPNTFYCADATTVAQCDSDGNVATTAACPAGGCVDGACASNLPANDSCAGAVLVESGAYFINRWDEGTDTSNLSTASCLGDDSPGSDFFYAIDLAANEILTVTANAYDNADDPAIYFTTDCLDLEASCVAGSSDGSRTQVTSYQATQAERIYIVADSESSFDTVWQSLFIEVTVPNCVPGAFTQACNADASAFEYCDDTGFIQAYDCGGVGTCDVASGRCANPIGEVCLDPFNGNPAVSPETFSGTLGGDDDFSLLTGNACTGSITPAGDNVYVVDLTAGQTLTASVVSTEATPEDLALYITNDCDTLPSSCVAGADAEPAGATPETATYTAVADETVFVIIDSFFVGASGDYDLTVDVQ